MKGKIFVANCPYCRTRSVAFTIKDLANKWYEFNKLYQDTFAVCGRCHRAVMATFKGESLYLCNMAPAPPRPPEYLPKEVKDYFRQGVDNLSGNYDAAGAMFRTALETALREKLPDSKARTLFDLIKEAETQQKLTPDLAKWAHQIRLGGRDAVHKKEPSSKEDAQDLHDFTELVLLYLYTLPGMLERSQARRESEPK